MVIYKQYNKEFLDKQYNNRLNVPDHEMYLQRWELLSRETEKKYIVRKNIPYGDFVPDSKQYTYYLGNLCKEKAKKGMPCIMSINKVYQNFRR